MSQVLGDFIRSTQDCGIQTRIIGCRIPLEFAQIHSQTNALESSDDSEFLQEYDELSSLGSDLAAHALHAISKEKNSSTTLILELLIDLRERLLRVENHLLQEQQTLLPLTGSGLLYGLGHGVLCSKDTLFATGGFYYARFRLPTLSQRIIGVFTQAISPHILRIVRIHSHNTQALDSFIASREMEQLRQHSLNNLKKRGEHD